MTRLIDADELHEIINWTHMKPPFSKKAVHRYIDMARTVDAKPVRHGQWIPKYDKWGDYVTTVECYECSACKETNWGEDKYCPWCGAKMDEKTEE